MLKINNSLLQLAFFMIVVFGYLEGVVETGVDRLFSSDYRSLVEGKKIGLVTNQTGINRRGQSTIDLFKQHQKELRCTLKTLFAPEHGLQGLQYAGDFVKDMKDKDGISVISLHGSVRRPSPDMLKDLDVIVYDIQDIGSRSYTYISTLFYMMEEAAKLKIPVIVLDRPNPLGGVMVDGPMLEEKWRSFVGYVNVPYCHGLTIGELANFFNVEHKVACQLSVVPMSGWKREMTFMDTGLMWIPTSPYVPEPDTPFFYPITGLLGELQFINIGIGYTLPFKVIGSPWIDADRLALRLNQQNYPGIKFQPFHFRPFYGRFSSQDCHGVLFVITDYKTFLPVSTQYLLMSVLKNLYPKEFKKALAGSAHREDMFNKVNGTDEVYRVMKNELFLAWKLRAIHQKEKEKYLVKRRSYFLYPSE